jgi:predicted ester cyclase
VKGPSFPTKKGWEALATSTKENKTIVRRFFELLELNQAIPEELLGPGFIYHVAGSPPKDLEATRQRMAVFGTAFSRSRHVIEDIVAEGDRVAFRTRLEMTHTGEFMGVAGSGEPISVVEMGTMRIANGKIAETWGLLDTLGLMRQTGAMPSSG